MGFALPAAIGAKVARPDAEVWVVVGDGGFQMTMCELATIAQEGIDINIAIINNGYLGMVRQWQEFFYERRYAATPLVNPDFVKLAEAFGLKAMRVTARGEVVAGGARGARAPGHGGHRLPRRAGRLGVPDGPRGRRPAQHDPAPERPHRNRSGRMNTFVVHVEDHPGVLTRVSGLFRRRGFNIESLTVGHTETPGVSRMTIAVDADEFGARRIEANLYKLIEVLRVDNVTRRPSIFRELAILKVKTTPETRAQIFQLGRCTARASSTSRPSRW